MTYLLHNAWDIGFALLAGMLIMLHILWICFASREQENIAKLRDEVLRDIFLDTTV